MKTLTDEEKKNFLQWSEGNKYLYELLCACGENEIKTFASCGGHDEKGSTPYLGIIINEKSIPFIRSMLGRVQDMKDITISTGPRFEDHCVSKGFKLQHNLLFLDDDELRAITFYANPHNCCELFYKMKKGIESVDKEETLLPKAQRFYEEMLIFYKTSRDDLKRYYDEGIMGGDTYATGTIELEEYRSNNSLAKNNKVLRFFMKLLPFKKDTLKRHDELEKKYGFLQREYEEADEVKKSWVYSGESPEIGHDTQQIETGTDSKKQEDLENDER